MDIVLVVSAILSWAAVLFLGFLVIGALRAMTFLRWQLEQMQATAPVRKGRTGLDVGKKAPDFNLPSVGGGETSLADFAGRKIFLVFVQTGCGPCNTVVPELNRLQGSGNYQVLVVNNGDPEAVRKWTEKANVEFPVLVQEKWIVSKRYEVFATPFAFLIDEQGVIASKGFVSNKQYMGFVLEGRSADKSAPGEPHGSASHGHESEGPSHSSIAKEVEHV